MNCPNCKSKTFKTDACPLDKDWCEKCKKFVQLLMCSRCNQSIDPPKSHVSLPYMPGNTYHKACKNQLLQDDGEGWQEPAYKASLSQEVTSEGKFIEGRDGTVLVKIGKKSTSELVYKEKLK